MNARERKAQKLDFERMIYRDKPSQIPTNVVRSSYMTMLDHCTTDARGLWCCLLTNARVEAKMTYRNVWNRDNTLNAVDIPICILYCSGCHKPPQVRRGDPLYADEVMTVAL